MKAGPGRGGGGVLPLILSASREELEIARRDSFVRAWRSGFSVALASSVAISSNPIGIGLAMLHMLAAFRGHKPAHVVAFECGARARRLDRHRPLSLRHVAGMAVRD